MSKYSGVIIKHLPIALFLMIYVGFAFIRCRIKRKFFDDGLIIALLSMYLGYMLGIYWQITDLISSHGLF